MSLFASSKDQKNNNTSLENVVEIENKKPYVIGIVSYEIQEHRGIYAFAITQFYITFHCILSTTIRNTKNPRKPNHLFLFYYKRYFYSNRRMERV